jgi:WD40 repeat protein
MQESALHGWRLADKVSLHMSNFPAKPKSLSWSRNGKWLATSGGQGLLLWPFKGKDGPMGRSAKQLAVRESLISSVAFQPKSNVVAIGYADGAILLLRQADEHMVIVRPPDGCAIGTLFWASSGNWLAFAACDRLAGVIDIAWGADGRL